MPVATMSDRMAQLEATSAILGEYMLRGYTLTDLSCETCEVTPLMRESAGAAVAAGRSPIQFCALCDGRPDNVQPTPIARSLESVPDSSVDQDTAASQPAPGPSQLARTSVPSAPPASSGLTASDLEDIYPSSSAPRAAPAAPSQADTAAQSISTYLLQGYSMLGTNCPNPTCRGIPLVGYPKRKDGTKDGRRMCVSCNAAWVNEADVGGMRMMEKRPASGSAESNETDRGGPSRAGGAEAGDESPRSRKRRELYATGQEIVDSRAQAAAAAKVSDAQGSKIRAEEEDDDMDLDTTDVSPQREEVKANTTNAPSTRITGSEETLLRTSSTLASTLDRLSASLDRHAPNDPTDQSRYFVDIKLHTEAMKDVLGVMDMIKRLQG